MGWFPTLQISNDVSWKKIDTKLHLYVNGKIIPEDEKVKLLGVTIDSNLNFNAHTKKICDKVSQKTSAL